MILSGKARLPLVLSGAAAIAAMLAIATPRAVHALAATLVQIANKPANSVPAMLAPAASQLYFSSCGIKFPGGYMCYLTPVPAGQTLFVETISAVAHLDSPAGPPIVSFEGPPFVDRVIVPMLSQSPANGYAASYVGTVSARTFVPASTTPACGSGSSSPGTFTCWVSGYLAPAQ